jgi:hypothetical protein
MMSVLNRFLQHFGVHLVRRETLVRPNHQFTMQRALQRCRRHGFPITTFVDIGASEGKLIMEVYNFTDPPRVLRFHQTCAHLEALGFRCYDMCSPLLRPRDGALWQMDLFFARATAELFRHASWN